MPDEDYDWADDETLSAEETMQIFEGLGPDVEVTGPTAHHAVPPQYRPAASLTSAYVEHTTTYPTRSFVLEQTACPTG